MSGKINVGHLYKKRIVKDTSGNIIDMLDEADGGWIIRKRQIVNQEKYDELLKKEKDRMEAAQAVVHQKVEENAPDRTTSPSRIDELEKRINSQDSKLDAILNALKK